MAMFVNRNAARARTKDVAGRVQKGHFSKQRHQVLARGLQNGPRGETRDQSTRPNPGRVEEITFAHAKNDICGKRDGPARATYALRTLSSTLYSSSSPDKVNRRKRSKILEALDINERESRFACAYSYCTYAYASYCVASDDGSLTTFT